MERERLQDYVGNGTPVQPTFSAPEMQRRLDAIRRTMAELNIDAALFTSYHNINYYADFLFCYFGRRYGLVVTPDASTSISAGIDGGQPWRRTFGGRNVTYTDWQKDNYFHAVRQLTGGVRRLGVEFDHVNLDTLALLKSEFPEMEFVDIAQPAMRLRMIKSPEEIAHIEKMTRIADIGGAAVVEAVAVGVPEHEIALHSTATMVREIARVWPHAELMDTWTWFQSGINTDGAHNPVTNKKIVSGDILSLNTFPMIFGYYTALERTLFCDHVDDASLDIWEKNVAVHRRGLELISPGAKCNEIALELNDMYRGWDLLKYRSFGYGHSFGVLSHYYGREAGVELREDIETELKPGMVVSMEPMVMLPEGAPGAGGYREHDILIVTETGAENITGFPFGPEHNIIRN